MSTSPACFDGIATAGADFTWWADLAGRTAAEAIACLFHLPLPTLIRTVSKEAVRCEGAASPAQLSDELAAGETSHLADLV